MNTRTTLILAIVLVAVGLYALFVAKPWQGPAKPAELPKARELWADKPKVEDIQRVEVVRPGEPRHVYVRKDDKWEIHEPVKATANKWQVDEMVRRIVEMKYDREYEKGAKDRPSPATTGLDQPAFSVTLTTKDNKTYAVAIGRRTPTGGDTYVQKAGSDTVFVANENLYPTFDRRLRDLRDKRVVDLKMDEVVRVKVEGVENFELVKAKDQWMLESPVRARADKTKAENLIRALTSLYAQDFFSDKPANLQAFGLAQPRLTATVTVEHKVEKKEEPKKDQASTQPAETQPVIETKTVIVQYGGPTDANANAYFAKIGGEDPVFTVSKTSYTDVAVKLNDLRDKQVVQVDLNKAKKIEAAVGGQSFTLEKTGSQWKYADGTVAELALVEDLIKAARDLKASQYESRESILGLDPDKPRARVAITQEGEPAPATLLVLGRTASGTNAYVTTTALDSVAVVPEDSVAQFLAPPISYRKRDMLTFPQAHANRLEIRRDGQKAVLTKTGTTWAMVEPVSAAADAEAVRTALSDLSVLRARKVVGQGNAAEYGLDRPAVEVTVTVQPPAPATGPATTRATATQPTTTAPTTAKAPTIEDLRKAWREKHPGEPLPSDLAETSESAASQSPAPATQPAPEPTTRPAPVGGPGPAVAATAPAGGGEATTQATTRPVLPPPQVHRVVLSRKGGDVYAMVDGGDLIYQVDPKIYDHLTAEMHDRTVVKFEVSQVTGVAIVRGQEEMSFRQVDGKWKYVQDETVALDEQKVKDLINAVRDSKALRFVSYTAGAGELAPYQLDQPALRVVVTTDGTNRIELLVAGRGPDDKGRYAAVVGSNGVFVLETDQVNKFDKKLSDFLPAAKASTT